MHSSSLTHGIGPVVLLLLSPLLLPLSDELPLPEPEPVVAARATSALAPLWGQRARPLLVALLAYPDDRVFVAAVARTHTTPVFDALTKGLGAGAMQSTKDSVSGSASERLAPVTARPPSFIGAR